MVAGLQSRIGKNVPSPNLDQSWLKPVSELPERSLPSQSHQNPDEECGPTNAALQKRSRRSNRPRSPGKKRIPLLKRIQMDQGEYDELRLKTRSTAQTEKSLIERIEIAPDDMNDQIYRPGSNGKLIDNTGSGHGRKRRLSDRQKHSLETSTSKQVNGSNHGSGSATIHHIDNQAVTPKVFLDHLLPLAQHIADVRMENSQVDTRSAQVNSSVITAEVLAQFSKQLTELRKELHHHQGDNGPKSPIGETGISISDDGESRSPLGVSLNGHGHHPTILQEANPHEPSEIGTKEPPLHDVRTPTTVHHEKGQLSSFGLSLPHRPPRNQAQPDSSRPYSSSELRGTRKDDHRTETRTWDHYDDRRHSSSKKSRRDDPDRRYRRSISPTTRRTTYSSSNKDRRNSSPPRYRNRRGSPLPHRRRQRSPSPERKRHSSEKSKDHISRRHTESDMSNYVKESYTRADNLGSMSLQDLLRNYRGIASSQQGTRMVSDINVPGIWFAFQGLQEIGMSTIGFKFDEQTALNWNLPSNKSNTTPKDIESLFDNQDPLQPSLELFCFSLNDVQMTIQNLSRDVKSHDLVKALSSLGNTWPPQGHLIVSINAESQNQKSWFPDTLRQKDSIKLEEFLHKGVNLLKFIQLSDLSGNVLVLLAKANGNDYTRLKILLPEKGGTPFQKAIPTISKG